MKRIILPKYLVSFIVIFIFCIKLYSQDINYMKSVIQELSSEQMAGRGYGRKGAKKASAYLVEELKKLNVAPIYDNNYLQKFHYPTTDFKKTPALLVDGQRLIPGTDFLISRSSKSVKGFFKVVPFLNDSVKDELSHMNIMMKGDKNKVLLTDKYHNDLKDLPNMTYAGVIIRSDDSRLTWSMPRDSKLLNTFTVFIKNSSINENSKEIEISVKNKKVCRFKTANIIGVIEGDGSTDKYLMIGAHYDHLGTFGSIYLPGAHDNASGVAAIFTFIKYLKENDIKFKHNLLIVLFSGEEAGLKGSKFFAENPPVDLKDIDFFVNLDMVGGGSEGITVVHGSMYPKLMEQLKEINTTNDYFPEVGIRGLAANSDHFPLYEVGVPSVFIYTRGSGLVEYHNVNDTAEKIKLEKGKSLINLLVDFVSLLDK